MRWPWPLPETSSCKCLERQEHLHPSPCVMHADAAWQCPGPWLRLLRACERGRCTTLRPAGRTCSSSRPATWPGARSSSSTMGTCDCCSLASCAGSTSRTAPTIALHSLRCMCTWLLSDQHITLGVGCAHAELQAPHEDGARKSSRPSGEHQNLSQTMHCPASTSLPDEHLRDAHMPPPNMRLLLWLQAAQREVAELQAALDAANARLQVRWQCPCAACLMLRR